MTSEGDTWAQSLVTVTPEDDAMLREISPTTTVSASQDVNLVLDPDDIVYRRSLTNRQFVDSTEAGEERPEQPSDEADQEPIEEVVEESPEQPSDEADQEAIEEVVEERPEQPSEEADQEPKEDADEEKPEQSSDKAGQEPKKDADEEKLEQPSDEADQEAKKEADEEKPEQPSDKVDQEAKEDADTQTYLQGVPTVHISVEYQDEASQTMYMSTPCPPLKYFKDIMSTYYYFSLQLFKTHFFHHFLVL